MSLQFGVSLPQGWNMELVGIKDPVEAYETLTRVAQTADEAGFASAWLVDHFHTVPRPLQEVTFECWTTTAALARDTRRIRIGQTVTCNGYRNPALLAKMASTVDVLSHGRLTFGIGPAGTSRSIAPMATTFLIQPTECSVLVRRCKRSWPCGLRKKPSSRADTTRCAGRSTNPRGSSNRISPY